MTVPATQRMFCMVITPLDAKDRIDEAAFRLHLRRMIDAGVGVYLGSGGSGEGHYLDPDELAELYKIGVSECKGKTPVYANPRETHTAKDMLRIMRLAARAGVEVVQAYQVDGGHGRLPSVAEQEQYYRDILDAFDHPTAISVHTAAGYIAPVEMVIKLCRAYPQIQVINLHGPPLDFLVQLKQSIRPEIKVYTGMNNVLASLALGSWGAQVTEPNIAPRLCASIINHYVAGDTARAGDDWAVANSMFRAVWRTPSGGVPVVKAVLHTLGLLSCANVRRPYLNPNPADVNKALDAMRALKIPELADLPK